MEVNIFDLDNPHDYSCMVRKFSGRSVLQIEVTGSTKPPDRFYLAFFSVEYFSGPIAWNSADFHLVSEQESIKTFKLIERFSSVPDEELLGSRYNLRLYTVETSLSTICIVAREVKKHTETWALS